VSFLFRYMAATRKLRLQHTQYKRLRKQFRRFKNRKRQYLAPYKKLLLTYEELLRLTRLERALFGWMHEISTGRVTYTVTC